MLSLLEQAASSSNVTASLGSGEIQSITKTVDFSANALRRSAAVKYTIDVAGTFPKKRNDLVCFFPTHHDEKLQVLQSSSYGGYLLNRGTIGQMNKELNTRLVESSQRLMNGLESVRIGIGYGKHLYKCSRLEGTLYVLWATINRENIGNVKNTTLDCAILMNMDGWGRVKGIFLLKEQIEHEDDLLLLPLKQGNPKFMWPKEDIFVCEKRPKHHHPSRLCLISRQKAEQIIRAPSKDAATWLPFEQNKFHSPDTDSDYEVVDTVAGVIMTEMSDNDGTDDAYSWTDTPRDVLYEDETPRTQSEMAVTLVSEKSHQRPLPYIPKINYMTPAASLLMRERSKVYQEEDPFAENDPIVEQRTRDEEDEARVEAVVMKNVTDKI